MDEAIDKDAIIFQLQLENEQLRRYVDTLKKMKDAVDAVPNFLEDMWAKAMANKTRLLIGLLIIYWAVSIIFLIYDRWPK